ncbi:vtamin B12-transporter permease [Escherichia coli]
MLTLARQQQRQNTRWLLCLSVLMLLALLLSLCAGERSISPGDWFSPRGELFVWREPACHVRWLYCWLVRRWLYPAL